jgi:hypothetical protein
MTESEDAVGRRVGLRAHLWALAGYLALAVLVTYPAILHFTTSVPGDLVADRDQNLWNLWWVREALLRPTNPFHTEMLYYPYGADLYYHTLGLPQGLIGLLPQILLGLPAAYNTVLLVAFTLSGYGAFRLGLMYTGRPLPSFLGGVVFAFTPYTLDALKGQLEVLSVQWMPFYAEAWIRASRAEEWNRRAPLLALAGLLLALAALSSLYYALYLGLFTVGYALYVGLRGRGSRTTLPKSKIQNPKLNVPLSLAAVLLVALVLLSPLVVGMVANYDNPRLEVGADPEHRLAHSADLLSFFKPPHDHPLLGDPGGKPGVNEHPLHDYLSLGYVALGLAVLGAWVARRERDVPFWAGLGLLALVLAMGPQLQVGRTLTGIPLPFALVQDLPGADAIAKPERFVVLARLSMGVLAAWGVSWVADAVEGRKSKVEGRRLLALFVMLVLLLVELPIHPRYIEPLAVPPLLRALPKISRGGLMELPFATQQGQVAGQRMLAQTVHGRPIMSGYLSRNYNSPIVDSCSPFWGFISPRDVPREGEEIASPLVVERLADVLNFYDIRAIVLYPRYAGPDSPLLSWEDREAYEAVASEVSDTSLMFSDAERLFPVERTDLTSAPPAFHIGAGWHASEATGGSPFRWLKDGSGTLCVFSPTLTRASLVMEGTAYAQERQVEMRADGRLLYSGKLPAGGAFAPITMEPVEWQPGVTEVQITATEPGVSPQSLDPSAQDDRVLTAGFRRVHLEGSR